MALIAWLCGAVAGFGACYLWIVFQIKWARFQKELDGVSMTVMVEMTTGKCSRCDGTGLPSLVHEVRRYSKVLPF